MAVILPATVFELKLLFGHLCHNQGQQFMEFSEMLSIKLSAFIVDSSLPVLGVP
jgi:hypothetical protein